MKLLVGAVVLLGWLIAAAPVARAQDAAPDDAASGPDAALPALDDGDGCAAAGGTAGDGVALALVVTAVVVRRKSARSRHRPGR